MSSARSPKCRPGYIHDLPERCFHSLWDVYRVIEPILQVVDSLITHLRICSINSGDDHDHTDDLIDTERLP